MRYFNLDLHLLPNGFSKRLFFGELTLVVSTVVFGHYAKNHPGS